MGAAAAERAASYVLSRAREVSGHLWYQGTRREKLGEYPGSELSWFAEHRVRGVGDLESRGLIGWAGGRYFAELCEAMIEPRALVEMQAEGRRCVALLPDVPAAEGLEFALHDLRHLHKFFEPEHHRAQIGFFRVFARAFARPESAELDQGLDATWSNERDKVLADMNGSPIFLFAVMKMKLKVAVRRAFARSRGVDPPSRNALDAEELAAYAPVLERWLDVLAFSGEVRRAARDISARRDRPELGRALLEYFVQQGQSQKGISISQSTLSPSP